MIALIDNTAIQESDKRIKLIANAYRLCGNDSSLTIEECDKYINGDLIWRNETIKLGYDTNLPLIERLIGQKTKIKEVLISRQSQ